MSEITKNIWLGSSDNINFENYQVLISLLPHYQIPKCAQLFKETNNFLHIPISDFDDEDIFPYIDKFIKFMDEKISKNKKIYIHCVKGISRSATFVILYLMYNTKNYDYEQILEFVKSKREIINPNKGFIRALKIYQEWLKLNNSCDLLNYCYTCKVD
jgi:atypical dual specificity phosphatase